MTRLGDALAAVRLGVDALGFIFVKKSPRYITPEKAAKIIAKLPPFISRVGVFVNESPEVVTHIAVKAGLDTVQLHGDESEEVCRQIPYTVVKAFGLRPDFDFAQLATFPAAGFLLDTWKGELKGGSGVCGDWSIAKAATERCDRIILAGGLNPTNVKDALDMVMPYGVDLNSGVEDMPGVKNLQKMRDAVAAVRAWHPHL